MIRTGSILAALGLAWAGTAMAQQSSVDIAAGETPAENEVGAPMAEETGVKGVYSLKGMMGLSAGGPEQEDAPIGGTLGAEAEIETGASGGDEEQAASN